MDFSERDPFVELLEEKERGEERAFFGRRDRELIERIRAKRRRAEETAARRSAVGRCPQCGSRLAKSLVRGVERQRCPEAHGVWVGPGDHEHTPTCAREMARSPALGRCPQCGVHLTKVERRGVETQKCPDGHGFWVPPGGLEQIRRREHDAWFDRYVHMRW